VLPRPAAASGGGDRPPATLLLASNRGPVSFEATATGIELRRGGGGMVSALGEVRPGTAWVCAALSEADRQASREGLVPGGVRMLELDPVVFDRAYNRVANSSLWFVHHLLHAFAVSPSYDALSRREWASYTAYDASFAEALAQEAAPGAEVLVQDYHLSLTPRQLRALRPDLRIGHFSHTPWAPPEYYRMLPDDVAVDVLTGLLGADAVGFLSPRWAEAFVRCCVDLLGTPRVPGGVRWEGRDVRVDVHPLGVDGAALRARALQADVQSRLPLLRELVGDRRLLLRIDRTELSKNIVRGLHAYRELLRTHPEHRGKVVHLAFAYPSRHDLPEYREYTAAVQRTAREVNEEFAEPGWLPVHLEVKDDYPRSLAACLLADVLLVNPLRDGMNLVAKEGPVLSQHGVALVLSRDAGAADELGRDAFVVHPLDVSQTAAALHEALTLDPAERAARSHRLASAATALPPAAWLQAQRACLPPASRPGTPEQGRRAQERSPSASRPG
jgi:trehalose 6-phosphate synthase